MKLLSGKAIKTEVGKREQNELTEPLRPEPLPMFNPFFSFTYTVQEMHVSGGRAEVSAKRVRFEDGKLTSEQFEGQMPVDAYARAVRDAQQMFADQTMTMLNQFSSLLTLPMSRRRD